MASDNMHELSAIHLNLHFEPLAVESHSKGDIPASCLTPLESEDGSSTSPSETFHRSSCSSDSLVSLSDSDPATADPSSNDPFFTLLPNGSSNDPLDHSAFTNQYDFFRFIEPNPVFPPPYSTLPPGGCPKYPVVAPNQDVELLPAYTPAAYKISIACRKVEWLSPYEVSLNRSWKNCVIELNSTQLNIYQIPTILESSLLNFQGTSDTENCYSLFEQLEDENLRSVVTTNRDSKFRRLCDAISFFETDTPEHKNNPSNTASKILKTQSLSKLVRSYSLQHAKIGLATDYLKKSNVLRLRLESEQFLLEFSSANQLIEWNLGLCIGRDISTDIQQREDPRYRTVPRRRRRPLLGSAFYFDAVARRNRSQSDSFYDGKSQGVRNRFSKLKEKLSAPASFANIKAVSQAQKQALKQLQQIKQIQRGTNFMKSSLGLALNRARACSTASYSSSLFNDSDDVSIGLVPSGLSHFNQNYTEDDFFGEDDLQDISDLQRSDDEEDFELLLDELQDDFGSGTRNSRKVLNNISDDCKWEPPKKVESQRKFVKNSLKCIKPLLCDESWINKVLVKPASISPLSLVYIRNMYCAESSKTVSRLSSLSNLPLGSVIDLTNLDRVKLSQRKTSASINSILSLPECSLARMKNHNLKEYIVGLHSLVPKDI